jgi:hypothetical protein
VVKFGNTLGAGERVSRGAGREGKCAENRKKILNSGNEPKNILKIKGLAFLRSSKRTAFPMPKTPIKSEK